MQKNVALQLAQLPFGIQEMTVDPQEEHLMLLVQLCSPRPNNS